MKLVAMKWICGVCAIVFLAGCQEQRLMMCLKEDHIRRHTEKCMRDYRIHMSSVQSAAPELKENVRRAVRAQWEWIVECDACDEALLPKTVKLGQREFTELVELIEQIQPMPTLPKSYFMTEPPPFKMPGDGPPPFVPIIGCCGGVTLSLVFYNAAGEYVESWDNSMVIPASRVSEWNKVDDERPKLMLPDDAYNRLINLPSSLKAEKLDKVFRKKINQEH